MKFWKWLRLVGKEMRCEIGLHRWTKGEFRYQCDYCGHYEWHTFPKTKPVEK